MNLAKRLKINPKISRLNRDAYKLITDEFELVRVCDEIRKAGFVSIDLETTNLNALEAKILGYHFVGLQIMLCIFLYNTKIKQRTMECPTITAMLRRQV